VSRQRWHRVVGGVAGIGLVVALVVSVLLLTREAREPPASDDGFPRPIQDKLERVVVNDPFFYRDYRVSLELAAEPAGPCLAGSLITSYRLQNRHAAGRPFQVNVAVADQGECRTGSTLQRVEVTRASGETIVLDGDTVRPYLARGRGQVTVFRRELELSPLEEITVRTVTYVTRAPADRLALQLRHAADGLRLCVGLPEAQRIDEITWIGAGWEEGGSAGAGPSMTRTPAVTCLESREPLLPAGGVEVAWRPTNGR